MKKVLIYLILFLFLFVQTGCRSEVNLPVYYGQFCNGERNSYKDITGLRTLPTKVIWKYNYPTLFDEIYFITLNAPTVAENIVYLGRYAAISLDTGQEIWGNHYKDYSDPTSGPYPYSSVVYGDKIYIVGGYPSEYLEAYNKDDGKLIWKSECIGDINTGTTTGRPIIVNGKIYLAASSTKNYEKYKDAQSAIWVWDANSGKVENKIYIEPIAESVVGKFRKLFPATTVLATDGKDIYGITKFTNDSTHRDYIFFYNPSMKKFTWFEPVEDFREGYREMIAVDKDVVAISLVGDQWLGKEPQFFIKVYDKISHKPLWENISKADRSLQPVMTISYIALNNGKLYTMTMDKRIVCFDSKTGKEIWSFKDKDWQSEWWKQLNKYGNIFRENDICVVKDTVYFNVDKAIYAFDKETGKLLWRKIVEKGKSFVNMMAVDNGLIVTYQDNQIGYDMPQNPAVSELWR